MFGEGSINQFNLDALAKFGKSSKAPSLKTYHPMEYLLQQLIKKNILIGKNVINSFGMKKSIPFEFEEN